MAAFSGEFLWVIFSLQFLEWVGPALIRYSESAGAKKYVCEVSALNLYAMKPMSQKCSKILQLLLNASKVPIIVLFSPKSCKDKFFLQKL